MRELFRVFEEHPNARSFTVVCNECGFSDSSHKHVIKCQTPSGFSSVLYAIIMTHAKEEGHYDFDIDIETRPDPVKELDVTITVD